MGLLVLDGCGEKKRGMEKHKAKCHERNKGGGGISDYHVAISCISKARHQKTSAIKVIPKTHNTERKRKQIKKKRYKNKSASNTFTNHYATTTTKQTYRTCQHTHIHTSRGHTHKYKLRRGRGGIQAGTLQQHSVGGGRRSNTSRGTQAERQQKAVTRPRERQVE